MIQTEQQPLADYNVIIAQSLAEAERLCPGAREAFYRWMGDLYEQPEVRQYRVYLIAAGFELGVRTATQEGTRADSGD